MAAKRDYYDVLGISRSADKSTIKRAYRKLAKKYHPDTNAGNAQAEEKFKEATEAYNVLSNPEKKKLYDQFGHAAFDGSAGGSGAYGYGNGPGGGTYSYTGPNGSFHEYHFEGGDMDDILKNIFGGGFSEGQAQRLSIARAMLKDAPILVLDEATAFADPDNEAKVQQAFSKLSQGKTVIMIAHRLSSIADADCICVLQNGQITESGTHEQLIEKNGTYAHMWDSYNKLVHWKVGA